MELSYDFNAPRYINNIPLPTFHPIRNKFDPLNANDKFLFVPNDPPQNQPPQKDPIKGQPQGKSSQQAKEALQYKPDSKKDIPKDSLLDKQKSQNLHMNREKPQPSKESIPNPQINVPKGYTSQMNLIMTAKKGLDVKENFPVNKPPSVNTSIEVIEKNVIRFKPPSITNKTLEERKPQPQAIKKEQEIGSKPKVPDTKPGLENNIFARNQIIQNYPKPQVPQRPNNFIASNIPKQLSVPQQKPNIFQNKASSTNLLSGQTIPPKQPTNSVPQTGIFVPRQPEKYNEQNFVPPASSSSNQPQQTNLFARRLEQNSKPVNHTTSQVNLFARRLQENQANQTKPKIPNNGSSISNFFPGINEKANNVPKPTTAPVLIPPFGSRPMESNAQKSTISTALIPHFGGKPVDTKPKDPVPQTVNRQININVMGGRGGFVSSPQGFNFMANSVVSQANNQRPNIFVGSQMGNTITSNNRPGQPAKTVSAPGIMPKQNTAPKRIQPCLFPIRIQRQWQEAHGKRWYELKSHEIPGAEESMKKRWQGQNRVNQGPNIIHQANNFTQAQQRNSYHNTSNNRGGNKPIFKF